MAGQKVLISRTGWTGELGFEVYNMEPNVDGLALWNHLLQAGVPNGLEPLSTYAMNPRRIEAGILNYGTDMDWDTTPFDLNLGDFVDFEHEFIGRDALLKANRCARFSGFLTESRDIKWGSPVTSGSQTVGRVRAFTMAPSLGKGAGYVLFESADAMALSDFSVCDRSGNNCSLKLHSLPLFDPEKRIPRGLETMPYTG